jgi:serpin B
MSKQLMSSLSGINLVSANGIWTRSSIKPEYIQTVKNIHDAMVDKIPTTFDPINKFVEQKTNGMIKDLFEGDVDPLIVAILVNAVYFKGEWKKQFNKSNTSQGIFHSLQKDNSILQRQAMFMSDKRMVQYGMYLESLRGAKGVLLEYGSQDVEAKFGAALFLPPENTIQSMTNLIADISALVGKDDKTGIKAMILNTFIQSEFDSGSVIVKLPRFRLSFGAKSLLTSLKRLGITAPFERNGMFKLMSNDEQVHIDDVLHKATIEVTEEGTVAAAGSGAVMMTRSLPTMITFDRPFIMIIYHLETGLPMFIGKIDDPEFI